MSILRSEDLQNNTFVIVRDWLSQPENGSWLLVLDNADDLDLFFKLDSSLRELNCPRISPTHNVETN